MLISCGKSEPRRVAEKALDSVIDEDYRGYFDCVYFPADKQEEKETAISIIEEKVKKAKEKGTKDNNVPVSYEFVSEQVNDDAGTAIETFNIKYASGKTEKSEVNLKKEEDGKWYIENKK
ncbi:hypothetical protein PRLR5107_25050 [Prevotella lacticifex]|uniref:DUF4878 domain-containing protein n=2 Tax=Prevotella lacticifex TaxID=2854755 RepID=A0A9R1CWG0_9BACT|nr:hypothetical protein PRLR5003_25070 [Prevotella lacticifex]GJG40150.1 hypothetical protein PRLR5019_21210 [Prevotella lacticifex]GJG43845.1 hypothetical protein PRLR5025_26310 [Prevotella lacticifex]GJG46528.1 hypothetical protein PRLR5027_21230 [Prevotella lacticifex]GJG49721.1 hypothetical protein PRLR5052_21340 [Prevotella lacticifex]